MKRSILILAILATSTASADRIGETQRQRPGNNNRQKAEKKIEVRAPVDMDGKEFCRVIERKVEMFGQPASPFRHCVKFENGMMIDNGNHFFGNEEESNRYRTYGTDIFIANGAKWDVTKYRLDGKKLEMLNADGSVMSVLRLSSVPKVEEGFSIQTLPGNPSEGFEIQTLPGNPKEEVTIDHSVYSPADGEPTINPYSAEDWRAESSNW